ncbi:MAG TPA: Ig-like domain-containing protein [Candidatus Acidoferrum sp.]|nr:Ig-like domain-containing protein [Candidatus Acidoferrum sp.]
MKMTQTLFQWIFAGFGMVVLGWLLSAQAATVNVTVGSGGNVFTPATTNCSVNDQITWVWAGGTHNVTSTNSAWTASGNQSSGTFSHTFTAAGNYFYYCTIHGTPTSGMKGEIIVIAPNVPPTVTLTNPPDGAVFAAPANITLQAAAADSDGSVTNVKFLVDANVLTNKTSAPYLAVTNNLAVGSHALTAIASDNSGATATNTVSLTVVSPVAVQLSAPQELTPGKFRFTYSANTGLSYVIQRSTNLLSLIWTSLATNTAGSGSINFTDQSATANPAFYRVGRLPNP